MISFAGVVEFGSLGKVAFIAGISTTRFFVENFATRSASKSLKEKSILASESVTKFLCPFNAKFFIL